MGEIIKIDVMRAGDWSQVREIYQEGIATGHATFQTEAPSWEEWNQSHLAECRIVARTGDVIVGWAAMSPVSSRCVYSGVAEVSVYVAGNHGKKGIGSMLIQNLIESSEEHGYWTLQSGIFPENLSSLRLHEKFDFRRVGIRERLGKMDGRWRDVILLERRSSIVGL
ncbi:phosphinothricin acetyltransferase [Bacillus sp. LL01]|uniref:GNAT family N-acetyltransferase n=1 Tax=Bacillus sp. LL01 TaxID=1665556 RepID=UPI00064D238D|nr:GNAT family N-acetyltransferase [Bacillus sp. LL01]KMJ59941.1 phosphinothricin acetyltransferase [Bacillus sp. LL01]